MTGTPALPGWAELHPGERLVTTGRPAWRRLIEFSAGFTIVYLLAVIGLNLLFGVGPGAGIAGSFVTVAVILAVFGVWELRAGQWILTDRRLVRRNGREMSLDRVEDIRATGSVLELRGEHRRVVLRWVEDPGAIRSRIERLRE